MKNIYKITKVVICAIALVLAFLFALNGRYKHMVDGFILDSWKGEVKDLSKYVNP